MKSQVIARQSVWSRKLIKYENYLDAFAGFVENMGAFVCTNCSKTSHIFGNAATDWAAAKSVPFLGSVPLEKDIMVKFFSCCSCFILCSDYQVRLNQGVQQLTGDEGLYMPNCQTILVVVLHALSLLLCHFINTTAYHLDRYESSCPSFKELYDWTYEWSTS